jgi:hypothetical protein
MDRIIQEIFQGLVNDIEAAIKNALEAAGVKV